MPSRQRNDARRALVCTLLLYVGVLPLAYAADPQADVRLAVGNFHYVLANDRLQVHDGNDIVLDVCLSPVFDGEQARIQEWAKLDENHYQAELGKFGKALVREQHGRLAYWIETPVTQCENVVYLSDGSFSGKTWRTFVSDEYEREWDKYVDKSIPLSSAYNNPQTPDPKFEDGGMVDPDEQPLHWIWNAHVRTWAFKGRDHWLGMSNPGAWPVGVTRLKMHKAHFQLSFDVIRPAATGGKMPVIYFCPGLADGFDALDEHRKLSDALGMTDLKPVEHPQWWSNPIFHYWDEWERQAHAGQITASSVHVLKTLQDWVKQVQDRTGNKAWNIPFEQYCFRTYGDYRPAENLGTNEEVRAALDAWRKEGIHVGHYYHPFLINKQAEIFKKHPDIFCIPKDPNTQTTWPLEMYGASPEFALVDWTNPKGREVMLEVIDYLLSSDPECRDFDILKSNNWLSPDPRVYDFHDPDWGIGDLMTFKVQKLIYQRAKQVKPHCMVSKYNALDPYMQPTFDVTEICEDFTATTDFWWRRGTLITRLLRNRLMWTSAWFVTRTKANEYFTSMSAWGIPETMAVTHMTHPYYPQWRPLQELHFRRRKSGIQVYLNAPQHATDVCHVTVSPDNFDVYRKKTVGPLAGWYGALALSPRCWVSYNETEARIGASESRITWVPLPPSARLAQVTRVLHDGREEPCKYEPDATGNRIQMYLEDCGGDVLYYRLRYKLDNEPVGASRREPGNP